MALSIVRRVPRLLFPKQNILRREQQSDATEKKDEIDLSKVSKVPEFPLSIDEKKLQQMRNKSRLQPQDRNILYGNRPYENSLTWYHNTVRYKKRMLGRYGLNSFDFTPGVAWPLPEQIEDVKEYERVAYPRTIQEEWQIIKEKRKKQEEEIRRREEEIAVKAAKANKWIEDLHARIKKKEEQLEAAKSIRKRIIEEVKRELNVSYIAPQDEKVMMLIEKKEKEYKKKLKEEKKKKKVQKDADKSAVESKK